jgi:hypothetical protein
MLLIMVLDGSECSHHGERTGVNDVAFAMNKDGYGCAYEISSL